MGPESIQLHFTMQHSEDDGILALCCNMVVHHPRSSIQNQPNLQAESAFHNRNPEVSDVLLGLSSATPYDDLEEAILRRIWPTKTERVILL